MAGDVLQLGVNIGSTSTSGLHLILAVRHTSIIVNALYNATNSELSYK